ncbi:efflux RND transporter permease subunit [Dongshaea marina]|uniref:efflux RND transporter permease subunit n=1 Tax=Dongshaea marina TaxID=2047966 RepID=UPI002D771293|nr:efflux RND transporter permease subunit [Dongshaea marina]
MKPDIASYFIQNKVISWMLTLIFLIGGIQAFFSLGRLEDPEFTIKDAMVVTAYPGATPQQVEEEVTYPIEKALQQLPYVDEINSISGRGLSQITVSMKNNFGPDELPQIWDELRRKVNDLKPNLPPELPSPRSLMTLGMSMGSCWQSPETGIPIKSSMTMSTTCAGSWSWLMGSARSLSQAPSRSRSSLSFRCNG